MERTVLITGASGLVGAALRVCLRDRGIAVRTLDVRGEDGEGRGDVRDAAAVRRALAGCRGVVHLAAVSRVVWGERDPARCWSTNVDGTRAVLAAAQASSEAPWVIFASSREVYGQAARLPATEHCPLAPINVYGRSKAAGERLVLEARDSGVRTAVVRLSNVYGSLADHRDRVVPAFVRAAVGGAALRVDGADHTFDFTHVEDVARGLADLGELLAGDGPAPPPFHLLTGRATSLGELARTTIELAGSEAGVMIEAPPRAFDVARFYGSPRLARELLGWSPRIELRDGLARMIAAARAEHGAA